VKVALYKITFIAAAGLIAAGAIVRRHTRVGPAPGEPAGRGEPVGRP
jgi:hypothetical protein